MSLAEIFSRVQLVAALVALALVALATGYWHAGRREPPKHTRRGVRRARRAAERDEDDQTVSWLHGLRERRIPPRALAAARVAALAGVLGRTRSTQPLAVAPRYDDEPAQEWTTAEWQTAPDPWEDPRPPVTVELPPLPVDLGDLGDLGRKYADLFDRHGLRGHPEITLTVVDPPPEHLDELRARLDGLDGRQAYMLPMPDSVRAGYWQPRAELPAAGSGPLDWDPEIDDSGLMHLAYPWSDQVISDCYPAVSHG